MTIRELERKVDNKKTVKMQVTGELVTDSQKKFEKGKECSTLSKNTFSTGKAQWNQVLSAVTHC